MLVAFAPCIQVSKLATAVLNDPEVGTAYAVPFALRRLQPLRSVRQAVSFELRIVWPFLLPQKPIVRPLVGTAVQWSPCNIPPTGSHPTSTVTASGVVLIHPVGSVSV